MHPRVFLDSFWRNDLRDEVFVAMDFRDSLVPRWTDIFRPAIESILLDGRRLKAVRVDTRQSGDSILSEIMNGVTHSQLVLADISVTDWDPSKPDELFWRNANVMYEVGLALACRQTEEVVLFRDDKHKLLFDVSHIPVGHYDPLDVPASIEKVREALCGRLRERELSKDLRVLRAVESMSREEVFVLKIFREKPQMLEDGRMAGLTPGLSGLLEKRIMRLARGPSHATSSYIYENKSGGFVAYHWTTFGKVVGDVLMGTPYERASVQVLDPSLGTAIDTNLGGVEFAG